MKIKCDLLRNATRTQVEEGNYGKIVAIDIETGAFEVAENSLTAAKQLLKRHPDAQIFGIRIGHLAVHRFGFHSLGHLYIKCDRVFNIVSTLL
jgi:hypothetical protein